MYNLSGARSRTCGTWQGFGLCTVLMLNQQSIVSLSPLKGIFIKVRSLSLALVEEGNDESTFYKASALRRKYCV